VRKRLGQVGVDILRGDGIDIECEGARVQRVGCVEKSLEDARERSRVRLGLVVVIDSTGGSK
jgi:hypothetical protein